MVKFKDLLIPGVIAVGGWLAFKAIRSDVKEGFSAIGTEIKGTRKDVLGSVDRITGAVTQIPGQVIGGTAQLLDAGLGRLFSGVSNAVRGFGDVLRGEEKRRLREAEPPRPPSSILPPVRDPRIKEVILPSSTVDTLVRSRTGSFSEKLKVAPQVEKLFKAQPSLLVVDDLLGKAQRRKEAERKRIAATTVKVPDKFLAPLRKRRQSFVSGFGSNREIFEGGFNFSLASKISGNLI